MEQETQKSRPSWLRRIGGLIPVLILFGLVICIILMLLNPVIDDSRSVKNPAPVVTPAYSAQSLWDKPLPTPEWITRVTSIYGDLSDFVLMDENPLCLSINLYPTWNWDAEYADPWDLLRRTTGIAVELMGRRFTTVI